MLKVLGWISWTLARGAYLMGMHWTGFNSGESIVLSGYHCLLKSAFINSQMPPTAPLRHNIKGIRTCQFQAVLLRRNSGRYAKCHVTRQVSNFKAGVHWFGFRNCGTVAPHGGTCMCRYKVPDPQLRYCVTTWEPPVHRRRTHVSTPGVSYRHAIRHEASQR